MALFKAGPAEGVGGFALFAPAGDLEKVFVDETLRLYRHQAIAALQTSVPNLPAKTPVSIVCVVCTWLGKCAAGSRVLAGLLLREEMALAFKCATVRAY